MPPDPGYVRHAEPKLPVTMMLSHFSGGNPVCLLVFHGTISAFRYVHRKHRELCT